MTKKWEKPIIEDGKLTKFNYIVQYAENLKMGINFDIGSFTYINSKFGVEIQDNVQIGSHCSIYSHSTIDQKKGSVLLKKNCKIGTHSTIMPNVTIGENSIISAYSFVNKDVPDNEIWAGVPASFKFKMMKIKKEKLVIIGAGGSGKDVLATLLRCNEVSQKYEILGFIDDDNSLVGEKINEFPVVGNMDWLSKQSTTICCVISNGFSDVRKKIVKKIEKFDIMFPTIVDPSVIIAKNVNIGKGSIIQAGTIINEDTTIGKHTFINLDCTIGHDCKISNYVTIAPGTHINGNIKIGNNTEVGSGTTTVQNVTIGKNCIIGTGTVLIDSIPDNSTVVGNPGKIIKLKSKSQKSKKSELKKIVKKQITY